MKLTYSKSKNSCTYYIQKSVRIGDRTTTKPIECLGSIEEIKARCGDQDPIKWAREYIKKLTLTEKEAKKGILLKLSSSMLIDKNVLNSCNAGYLFRQDIYYSLGLDKICRSISEKYKFDYDLNKDNLEQHLIVTYSIKYRNYQRSIRERQIERAKKFVDSPTKLVKNKANDPKRFVEQEHCTPDGEAANRTIASLNQKQIDNEAKYDGLYAVCTNLEYDVADMFHLLSSVLIPGISPSSQ